MAGTLAGNVSSLRTGQPISGASLKLTGEGVDNTESSGPDGSFAFNDLAAGNNYELLVTAAGYEKGDFGPLVVLDDITIDLKLALEPVSS